MTLYKVRYKGFLQDLTRDFKTWSDAERWTRTVGKSAEAIIDKYEHDELVASYTLTPIPHEIEKGS